MEIKTLDKLCAGLHAGPDHVLQRTTSKNYYKIKANENAEKPGLLDLQILKMIDMIHLSSRDVYLL